jgi:hypothetical protein
MNAEPKRWENLWSQRGKIMNNEWKEIEGGDRFFTYGSKTRLFHQVQRLNLSKVHRYNTIGCTNTERRRGGGGGLKPDQCRRDQYRTEIFRVEKVDWRRRRVQRISNGQRTKNKVTGSGKIFTPAAHMETKQEARVGVKLSRKCLHTTFLGGGEFDERIPCAVGRWADVSSVIGNKRFLIGRLILKDDVAARDCREWLLVGNKNIGIVDYKKVVVVYLDPSGFIVFIR